MFLVYQVNYYQHTQVVEDGNKVWGNNVLRENILVNYGDNVNYIDELNIGNKKHLYLINVYDNNFFRKNKDIGFKCISEKYLNLRY